MFYFFIFGENIEILEVPTNTPADIVAHLVEQLVCYAVALGLNPSSVKLFISFIAFFLIC